MKRNERIKERQELEKKKAKLLMKSPKEKKDNTGKRKFNGNCNYCGKKGHKEVDCCHKPEKTKISVLRIGNQKGRKLK